ncbi:MAG TPA: hypothetical protein VFF73_22595 [Planctomycetota bacterium]|nr:hypothetical protein [Planctomycetota bacterium]
MNARLRFLVFLGAASAISACAGAPPPPPPPGSNGVTIATVSTGLDGTGALATGVVVGDCGSFWWWIRWELARPAANDGYIVQEVHYDYDVHECHPETVGNVNTSVTYWEAWYVAAGQRTPALGKAAGWAFDDSFWNSGEHTVTGFTVTNVQTYGSISINGLSKFFARDSLPPDFRTDAVQYAGGLPATYTRPTFWDPSGATVRSVTVAWNCRALMKSGRTHHVETEPPTKEVSPPIGLRISPHPTHGMGPTFYPLSRRNRDAILALIDSAPTWEEFRAGDDARLKRVARELIRYDKDALRMAFQIYTQSKGPMGDDISKSYLLLHAIFDIPARVDPAVARTFGGWLGSPARAQDDLLWPLSRDAQGKLVLAAHYSARVGLRYDAGAEFDYLDTICEPRTSVE